MSQSIAIKVLFEPRDLWVGVFWKHRGLASGRYRRWTVFICIVPCLPIRVTLTRGSVPRGLDGQR